MSSLMAMPDGGAPSTATSPSELVGGIPAAFRYLEANERVLRALAVSELGGRVQSARQSERLGRTDVALQPLAERLDGDEYRRLRGVVGLLASFAGYDALTSVWGLSREEAAEASAWAIRVLCERARRSGVAP